MWCSLWHRREGRATKQEGAHGQDAALDPLLTLPSAPTSPSSHRFWPETPWRTPRRRKGSSTPQIHTAHPPVPHPMSGSPFPAAFPRGTTVTLLWDSLIFLWDLLWQYASPPRGTHQAGDHHLGGFHIMVWTPHVPTGALIP